MHLKPITFTSNTGGTSLLVLGAVHGNEQCGTHAIRQISKEIESSAIKLLSGKITLVDVCNPQAFENDTRYIDDNLNRIMKMHYNPQKYEEYIANELAPLIASHDYILDIHSNHTSSRPFAFLDYPCTKASAFCNVLPIETIVTGWPELFHPEEDYTTLAYAHRAGNVSVTIECGEHEDPKSIDIAYKSIIQSMAHLGISKNVIKTPTPQALHVDKRILKEKQGNFTRDWQHMDMVKSGDVIGIYEDGDNVIATHDGYIFIPSKDAHIGDEWFYLAKSDT